MAANEPIPIFTTVQDAQPIQAVAARETLRYAQLAEHFTSLYGHKPTYIARAPGRVNIIGEHIDYALFSVCPMAVEQDVLIACAARPENIVASSAIREVEQDRDRLGHVNASNIHPKYTPQSFAPMLKTSSTARQAQTDEDAIHIAEDPSSSHDVQWHLDIDKTQLRWESYVKAGYYGVLERFFAPSATKDTKPLPVDILVTGSVPAGSGLSSSAAMVVASTLAFLAVNEKLDEGGNKLTKGELVEMAVENEKRVGVNSGGMDQAASVTSLPTSALYISFFPVFGVEPVPLPITRTTPRAVFVCANSGIVCDKVVGAKTRYNLRVVETLVAARVLAVQLSLTSLLSPSYPTKKFTLREVLSAYLGSGEAKGQKEPRLSPEEVQIGLERLLKAVERLKVSALRGDIAQGSDNEEGLTMEEMVRCSELSPIEFYEIYLSWVDVEATHFQLYKRAKHVFSEALRVLQFRATCIASSSHEADLPEDTLLTLGGLMNDSQQSCSELFECSCPELDELTSIARSAGAYGSRLTGAGWGGCTISLVPADAVKSFIAQVKNTYGPYKDLSEEQLKDVIFATQPSNGAFVLKIEDE